MPSSKLDNKYDLAIVQEEDTLGTYILTEPFRSGAVISGTSKLAQNFVAELLTRVGSVKFDPGFGCSLIDELRGRNTSAIGDLQGALSRAIDIVTRNIYARQTGREARDEIFNRAEIVSIAPWQDRIDITLRVISLAGTSRQLKLPVDLSVFNS